MQVDYQALRQNTFTRQFPCDQRTSCQSVFESPSGVLSLFLGTTGITSWLVTKVVLVVHSAHSIHDVADI
jgi:hypothetical protein